MHTLSLQDLVKKPEALQSLLSVLDKGGLVCLPCKTSYRIVADLNNAKAVQSLLQSKHRTKKMPSLVFIKDVSMLNEITVQLPKFSRALAKAFWPGELTFRLDPNPELFASSSLKQLTKATGKISARVPSEPWIRKILNAIERPLLVSSANRQKKQGSTSPAQIRKNFSRYVDIFIDAGDIPAGDPSTVIDFIDGEPTVVREGSIPCERVRALIDVAKQEMAS